MNKRIGLSVTALALLALAAPMAATAATYCVGNATELQTALTAAANSTADDEIRLRQGVYAHTQSLIYQSGNLGWLSLTGGYVASGGDPCGQLIENAGGTVLDGENQRQILLIHLTVTGTSTSQSVHYRLHNMTLRNGVGTGFQRGGALYMHSGADFSVMYWLDNLIVTNSSGYFAGGAHLNVQRGYIKVTNSLFANNSAPTSAYGHLYVGVVTTVAPHAVLIANSSFVNGTCAGQGGRGCGLGAGLYGGARMDLVNSLFWNNAVSDVNLEGTPSLGFGTAFYNYSRITTTTTGNITPTISNALVGDPGFVDAAAGNFRLRDDSVMLDRGLGALPVYGAPPYDLDGGPRRHFTAMDPGPYENATWDIVFANGFQ